MACPNCGGRAKGYSIRLKGCCCLKCSHKYAVEVFGDNKMTDYFHARNSTKRIISLNQCICCGRVIPQFEKAGNGSSWCVSFYDDDQAKLCKIEQKKRTAAARREGMNKSCGTFGKAKRKKACQVTEGFQCKKYSKCLWNNFEECTGPDYPRVGENIPVFGKADFTYTTQLHQLGRV